MFIVPLCFAFHFPKDKKKTYKVSSMYTVHAVALFELSENMTRELQDKKEKEKD